jgi:hypothetical protein
MPMPMPTLEPHPRAQQQQQQQQPPLRSVIGGLVLLYWCEMTTYFAEIPSCHWHMLLKAVGRIVFMNLIQTPPESSSLMVLSVVV